MSHLPFEARRAGPEAPARPVVKCPGLGDRDDVDGLAVALLAELHRAGGEGEQRVVTTTADVDARVEVGAALADEDLAGLDNLAAEALHAQELRVGVATVARRARALLVSHYSSPFESVAAAAAAGFFAVSMPVTRIWVSDWR